MHGCPVLTVEQYAVRYQYFICDLLSLARCQGICSPSSLLPGMFNLTYFCICYWNFLTGICITCVVFTLKLSSLICYQVSRTSKKLSLILGRMTKRGTPPTNIDKKGDTAFRRRRDFRRKCGRWYQSNGPTGCMHYSSYIHHYCIRTAKCRTACGTSTPLSKKPNVCTGNISDLRTVSVCFIQEEPHNIPCILNGGGRIHGIGACPVTTDCIVAMS